MLAIKAMVTRGALLSVAFWLVFLGVIRVAIIPPESCGETSAAAIRRAAEEAAGWMKRNQLADGRYVYLYYPETDSTPNDYNEVRHAGVTMSLYQAAGRLPDPEALAVADKALQWEEDNMVRAHGWAALAPDGNRPSLGASALMLVGLAERRLATGDETHDELMHEVARFIASMQREDGGFYVAYYLDADVPDTVGTSRYFPGESLWALALMHEAFPGEGWDGYARDALQFITTMRDEVEGVDFPPLPDQWAAYGLGEMAEWGLTEQQIEYSHRLAERFGLLVRTEAQREGSPWGVLVRGRDVRASGMGTWVEGLTALWRLASVDPRMADVRDDIERRAVCASGILAARQVTADEAEDYPRPGLAQGAWFRGGETRMDDMQHAFSGLIYTLDAMQDNPVREPDGTLESGR